MGFDAKVISGVIMITISDEKSIKKVSNAVKSIGYDSSFGITIERQKDEIR